MNILLTGSNGQLGHELQRILHDGRAEIGPIPSCYSQAQVIATDVDTLDITDRKAIATFIARHPCDLIINCAAMTNVDGCEQLEDKAYLINAIGPKNLAEVAEVHGAKFVQVSTDYVFSGTDPYPRAETDEAKPVSAYGRTKLSGELFSLNGCSRCFVIRTAWLYGYIGKNFVKTMLRLGESHNEVTVVDDQQGNPTSANDLAYEILKIAATEYYGIYHCTNEGTCSWADFAEAIMHIARKDCAVIRCTSEEYAQMNPASAKRPAYSSLANTNLTHTIGNEMRPWKDALVTYLNTLATQDKRYD